MLMPIDIFFINAVAQFIAIATLMVIIFALRQYIPQRVILVGFEALLLTVLIRRVSEIAAYLGISLFSRAALAVLSWVVIGIIYYAFVRVWRRRVLLHHIDQMMKTSERYTEVLKQNGDALKRA